MIDMVVHRHKLRDTLAGLVGILMDGRRSGAAKAAPGKGKPIGYIQSMNGHAVDGKVVESLARGSGIVEPEAVGEGERFMPAPEARRTVRPEADAAKQPPRATPKDLG
jgi:acetyl-CoA carboxylase carboxyl transferase subunit beta